MIDGDGNISTWIHRTNGNRQWCLRISSSSITFIQWLDEKILNTFDVKGKLYTFNPENRENPVYVLKFGKIAAAMILRFIYYDQCLSLERKYVQARLCLQQGDKMVNYAD